MTTATALAVAVPEAEPVVADLRARHDPAAAEGVPAHITILFPCVPIEELDEGFLTAMSETFSPMPAFDFALTELRFFGEDVAYLAPEPAEPFVALTDAARRRWPSYPPYEGRHERIVPHLTIADGSVPPDLAARIVPHLPIASRAREVALLARGTHGQWGLEIAVPLSDART